MVVTSGSVTRRTAPSPASTCRPQKVEGDPITVDAKPTAMAFDDKILYVVNSGDNTISLLNGSTGGVFR